MGANIEYCLVNGDIELRIKRNEMGLLELIQVVDRGRLGEWRLLKIIGRALSDGQKVVEFTDDRIIFRHPAGGDMRRLPFALLKTDKKEIEDAFKCPINVYEFPRDAKKKWEGFEVIFYANIS